MHRCGFYRYLAIHLYTYNCTVHFNSTIKRDINILRLQSNNAKASIALFSFFILFYQGLFRTQHVWPCIGSSYLIILWLYSSSLLRRNPAATPAAWRPISRQDQHV